MAVNNRGTFGVHYGYIIVHLKERYENESDMFIISLLMKNV